MDINRQSTIGLGTSIIIGYQLKFKNWFEWNGNEGSIQILGQQIIGLHYL